MSRHAQVQTLRPDYGSRPRAAVMPAHVEATVTLAWAECSCKAALAVAVRPWETTGDVLDAALRAAGWDAARDECSECMAERGSR